MRYLANWNRVLLAAVLAGGALAVHVAAADEALPKAETVLDKYIEATGGKAAYKKLHSEILTSSTEFVGKSVRASIVAYKAEPKKSYSVVEIEGIGKVEQGINGDVAWERSALRGPRLKDGEEKFAAMHEASLHEDWREFYKKAEMAGVETVDDQTCYKLVLTPNEGKPETRYYDKKSNLLVKVSKLVTTQMGEIPAEFTVSDYKKVGDILVPHSIRQKALNQEFLVVIQKIDQNPKIPDNRFDLPDDIKALVAKKAKTVTSGK
jgi:zinc protease